MTVTAALLLTLAPTLPENGVAATVDTVDDVVDFPAPRTLAELPGPDGKVSLREAVTAANNTPGPQTIGFAIPPEEWWLVEDVAVLRIELGGVVLADDGTTLDFTTQTTAIGDTNPDGPEVGIYGIHPNYYGSAAIGIGANDCVVRGLGKVWNRVSVVIGSGTGNRVVGCQTSEVHVGSSIEPGPSFCTIGGTAPGDGNVLGSVRIVCHANDNRVIGNQLGSAHVVSSQYCTYPLRNRIGGPTPGERNVISGYGYFGSEGFPQGEGVEVHWARDTVVEGNYIGVTPDGTARAAGNGPIGIEVADSIDTLVRDNLIAGIRMEGANHHAGEVYGDAILVTAYNAENVGVVIEGNTIGTDVTGTYGIDTLNGITVSSLTVLQTCRDVRIGGLGEGQANRIAFVERTGVGVCYPAPSTEVSGNSIRASGLLGIDLGPAFDVDGVTPNDAGDADAGGGNEFQNFPILQRVLRVGSTLQVLGQLESRPSRPYRIELFASQACDPSGFGEGTVFLGSTLVTTDERGVARVGTSVSLPPGAGDSVTATATDLVSLATSEFSACATAVEPATAASTRF